MFLHLSVSHSVQGEGVIPACNGSALYKQTPPGRRPLGRYNPQTGIPWAGTPPQLHPLGRYTQAGAPTPSLGRHPHTPRPEAGTPLGPEAGTPQTRGRYIPRSRHPPWQTPPQEQTPPADQVRILLECNLV